MNRTENAYGKACIAVIVLNILVFVIENYTKASISGRTIREVFALYPSNVISGKKYYQFFTSNFLHADYTHILYNMISLFSFGIPLEMRIGTKQFGLFYFIASWVCGIITFFIYLTLGNKNICVLGASGVICAVMLIYCSYYPGSRIMVGGFMGVPAKFGIIAMIALEAYYEFAKVQPGISHIGHLSGFAVGYVYLRLILHRKLFF